MEYKWTGNFGDGGGGGGGGPDTTSIARDGSRPPTANIDWDGFAITGLNFAVSTIGFASLKYINDDTAPTLDSYKARGTEGTPLAILDGDNLGTYRFIGYDGTGFNPYAAINVKATENWSATNHGTEMHLSVTDITTSTMVDKLLLDNDVHVLSVLNLAPASGTTLITTPNGFEIEDNTVLHFKFGATNILDIMSGGLSSLLSHGFYDRIDMKTAGSAGLPVLRFDIGPGFNTGIYQSATDAVSISNAGVLTADFTTSGLFIAQAATPTGTGAPVANQYNASSSSAHGLTAVSDGSNAIVSLVSYGGATGRVRGYAAGGSAASPSAVAGTGGIIQIEAQAFDGTTFAGASSIQLRNTETWSGTAHGSDIVMNVVPNTTTSSVIGLQIKNSGQVTLQPSGTTELLDINSATETAGADALTLTNGPTGTAGDPDVYLKVVINGTNYVIPAWAV